MYKRSKSLWHRFELEDFLLFPRKLRGKKKIYKAAATREFTWLSITIRKKIIRTMAHERREELMYEFPGTITVFLLNHFVIKIISHTLSRRHKVTLACPKPMHREENSLWGEKFVKCRHLLRNKKQQQPVMPAPTCRRSNLMQTFSLLAFLKDTRTWKSLLSAKPRNAPSNAAILILGPKR